jgi:putative ABC transport system permease protein
MSLLQDVRISARGLAARPGFTIVAAATLALGIGATTALFSVVHGVLLRPLPYPDSERIVALWQTARDNPQPTVGGTVPHLNYLDWKEQAHSFEAMALYTSSNVNVTAPGDPEVLPAADATPDFFRVFGATPIVGREFTREDDHPGAPRVAAVSHGLWQGRLGGRPEVIGSTIEISGIPWEIVGVAPPGFDFPSQAQLWRPPRNNDETCGRGCVYLDGVGKLRPGVSLETARSEMRQIAERLEAAYPEANTNTTAAVARLQDQIVGGVRPALLMLLGAVVMVLLIACVNVANLVLVRGAARQQEIAVRSALGGGRGRLVRLLLAESVLLAGAGTLLGVLLAWWGVDVLKQLAPPGVPRLADVGLSPATLLFAAALAAATAIVFGLAPALQVLRTPLVSLLGARGTAGHERTRWTRSALLVAEVALSVTLLAGAGLLVRSMMQLQATDPGWRMEGVSVFTTGLGPASYPEPAHALRAFDELDRRLSAIPGVRAVARISGLPLGPGINVLTVQRTDRPPAPPGQVPNAVYRVVDDEYFTVAGIPLVAGRTFDSRDAEGAQPVVIVSREMAEQFWPGEDPLGREIEIGGSTTRTVVGIVGGVRSTNLAAPPQPEMYVPHHQTATRTAAFLLQSELPPGEVLGAARAVVRGFDPQLPIFRPRPFADFEAQALAGRRFTMLLLTLFAVLALSLAAVGVYGVVAYAVSQRTREIGVRVALGADATRVVRLVVWQGIRPASLGLVLGAGGALAAGRVMAGQLYEVRPHDPLTLAAVVAILLAAVLLACAAPAWRAASIPPSVALRQE